MSIRLENFGSQGKTMDMVFESFGDLLASDPLSNKAEEEECRRRGAHQAFIITASMLLGWESRRILEEYESAYKKPILVEDGVEIPVNDEHLERIVHWSKEAENDVTLLNEEDFALIEGLVQYHRQDAESLTQERFQQWIQDTDFKGRDQFNHLLQRLN